MADLIGYPPQMLGRVGPLAFEHRLDRNDALGQQRIVREVDVDVEDLDGGAQCLGQLDGRAEGRAGGIGKVGREQDLLQSVEGHFMNVSAPERRTGWPSRT